MSTKSRLTPTTPRAIIIGTGAGGLAAAAWFASRGVEVVALERAKQLGGYLNPFQRKRFHFDPGVHYMGQCGPGHVLGELLDLLDLDTRELFCPLADDFDLLRFPDLEVRVCAGFGAYRDRLAESFPERRRDLDRYFGILRRFDLGMEALQRQFIRPPRLRDLSGMAGLPTMHTGFKRRRRKFHYSSISQYIFLKTIKIKNI